MRDRLVLGFCSGAAAQALKFPLTVLTRTLTGIPRYSDYNVAAGIFLTPARAMTLWGEAEGLVASLLIGGILGVLLVYLLTATGMDYWRFKGIGTGLFAWIGLWGVLVNMRASHIVPTDFGSNMWTFVSYMLWGYLAAAFALRWGDNALFSGVRKLS